ncbi:MAG: T9SS type A sorting domain-containing protein [Candidatus Kapaibacterium sp.]
MKHTSNTIFSNKLYLSIAVVCLLLFAAPSLNAQWKQCKGPFGGNVTSFAAIDSTIFAGVFRGGVFKSNDNGESWVRINNGLTDSFVYSLVSVGSVLFAGTGGGSGVYRSVDKGENWVGANNGLGVYSVHSMAVSGTRLFANTLEGSCYSSKDNGNNWVMLHNGLNTGVAFGELCGIDTSIFIRMSEGGIIRITENTGLRYLNDVPFFNAGVNCIAGLDKKVFVSTNSKGIFRSSDNGDSWVTVNNGLTSIEFYKLAVNPTHVFASIYHTDSSFHDVYSSFDNGEHWVSINSPKKQNRILTLFVQGSTLFASFEDSTVWKYEDATSVSESETIPPQELTITPNPASTTFKVSGWDAVSDLATVSSVNIVNTMGIDVNVQWQGRGSSEFDISNVANGVYFIQFRTQAGIVSKPFVVSH